MIPGFIRENVPELTFLEMLALIRSTKDDRDFNFCYPESNIKLSSYENYLHYIRKLINYFVVCTKDRTDLTCYVFGKLSVKSLYLYDSLSETGRGYYENNKAYRSLVTAYRSLLLNHSSIFGRNEDGKLNDKTTVRDFIMECFNLSHICWLPAYYEPEQYIKSIRAAYNVASLLLVDHFVDKYCDRYDIVEIKNRVIKTEEPKSDEYEDLFGFEWDANLLFD